MSERVTQLDVAIDVSPSIGLVSGLWTIPAKPQAVMILAHGAGAGMRHPFTERVARALADRGIATLRFQFPYTERGSKRPDPPKLLTVTVRAAIDAARALAPDLPLFAGGKSLGSRMTTTLASERNIAPVRGIICYGFPLHPPKEPGTKRAEHLKQVEIPILFLQGTRDDLADVQLVEVSLAKLPHGTVRYIDGSDHGFDVLKSSGRTPSEVMAQLVDETLGFITRNLGR